jgi:hypothetical protein
MSFDDSPLLTMPRSPFGRMAPPVAPPLPALADEQIGT